MQSFYVILQAWSLCNITGEAGMISAVSIQENNREYQRIRFATMSNEKRPKGMPKKRKHTIVLPDKVCQYYMIEYIDI